VRVLCSDAAAPFFEREFGPACVGRFERLSAASPPLVDRFDMDAYNDFMASPEPWRALRERWGARRALMVQSDGVLCRRGLEADARLMAAVYVGAPWARCAANAELEARAPSMVGNGGLSLRDVVWCEAVASATPAADQLPFMHRMARVPEDVFFADMACREGAAAKEDDAERFAFEQRAPSARALGMHKPWPYMSPGAVADHLDAALSELAGP
jgi:hypothetical protein